MTPCCKRSHPHPIAPGGQLLVLVTGFWVPRAWILHPAVLGRGQVVMKAGQGVTALLSAAAHHHPLLLAAAVPKPPIRDSPPHPAAAARGAQPGGCIAAHPGEELGREHGAGGWPKPTLGSFPSAPLPSVFPAAPAAQPQAASGRWRDGQAQIPLLLQHRPVEQAGGLGRRGHLPPPTCEPTGGLCPRRGEVFLPGLCCAGV